jgi:DNA sulfur modification protein DndD
VRLERIVLRNIRQYAGTQELEFAAPGPRNVTLVRGQNGAGKTHLLEALHWVLYGGLGHDELRSMISKGALATANQGDTIESGVDLWFSHDGRDYQCARAVRVRLGAPTEAGMSFGILGEEFSLYEITSGGESRLVSAPVEELAGILPKNAAAYFFFDGERIDTFARPDNAVGISQAVREVLKFAYLERAISHLKVVRTEYEAELRRSAVGTEVETLLEKKKEVETDRAALEHELQRIPEEIGAIESRKALVEKALLQTEEVRDEMLRRQQLQSKLEGLRRLEHDQVEGFADLVISAPLVLARSALDSTAKEANTRRKKGEIPSRVRQVVVNDLLEAGMCICGRELAPGSTAFDVVKALAEHAVSNRLEERALAMTTTLPSLEMRAGTLAERLRDALSKHEALLGEMRDTQEALSEVDKALASARQEDIAELVDKNKRLEKDLRDLHSRQLALSGRLDAADREIAALDAQLERNRRLGAQAEALRRRVLIAQNAERALTETQKKFGDEVRAEVESGCSEMFKRLVWKTSHFDRVEVSEAFGLSVVDRWGEPALGDLSAGETEVLSLSFIVTMGRVAAETIGSSAPIVIDTPFGRLSEEPRANIAAALPTLLDQLVLFVTDTELVGTEDALRPHVGRRYDLTFDEQSSSTRIEEVSAGG